MMQFLFYTFDSGIDGEPGSTRLQVNAPYPYGAVSRAYIHKQTDGGADARLLWLSVELGTTLYLQDKNDSTIAHHFTVVGLPVDRGYYVELPIRWESSAGAALNANQDIAVGLQAPAPVITPPPTDAPALPYTFSHVQILVPLVSLASAKEHLKITDTTHDAEVNQKLEAAQQYIVARLSYAADPNWTENTVPRQVQSAILMLTAALYEVRGGEDDRENFRKTFEAITVLLALNRDPALA